MTTLLVLAGCKADPIATEKPPPASEQRRQAAPEYQYQHQGGTQTASPAGPTTGRPVVALLRTGDIAEFGEALPFGRQKVVMVPDEQGQTHRVEVVGQPDEPVLMPASIRQFLLKELVDSQTVILVDRERILELLREQAFAQSKHVAADTAPRPGRLYGVHYFLEAAFFPAGTQPAEDSVWAEMDQFVWRKRSVDVSGLSVMYLTVYDVETGVIDTIGYGADANDRIAVRRAVENVARRLATAHPPIRVVGFDEDGNPILDRGSLSGVRPNDEIAGPRGARGKVRRVDPISCIGELLQGEVREGDDVIIAAPGEAPTAVPG